MISIREKVFETNSSSAHSLTFSNPGSAPKSVNMHLDFKGGSYQWNYRSYHDSQSKLSYWLNAFTANQRNILEEKNAKLKGVNSYWITDYLGEDGESWGKTKGPSDLAVYKEVLQSTADHLKAIFDAFYEAGVIFHFEPYKENVDSIYTPDEYIETFLKINSPTRITNLCEPFYDYIVDLDDGIDHQSGPKEDGYCRRLAEFDPATVVEWVLGDGYFETGNDND